MNAENPFFPLPFESNKVRVDDDLKALFVGSKYQSYYQDKFEKITLQKATVGFNIAAFLLGVIWLFYRKMYVYGLIYIGFIFTSSIVIEIFQVSATIDRSITIAMSVFMGLWGNSIYKYYVEKKIKQINEEYIGDPVLIEEKIKACGGTNSIAAGSLFILVVIFFSIGIWVDSY